MVMGNCFTKSNKCAHASSINFSAGNTKSQSQGLNQDSSSTQQTPSTLITSKVDETSTNINLKSFSFNDLKNATKNFRQDFVLGEGGFGCVFKGWIDENTLSPTKPGSGIVVAIKRLKAESFQGHKEWLKELNQLVGPHE
ncbi:hypothetical protein Patl1_30174 [Pistacia atlantica]|uniref:Uncharacterized protein n=1 Tax=Pistacia atlantica TaxID=434234 RepID=A0ACC1AAT7_9ROSI|nr:hypothetical protein Patl1_30174 [Pistacia atlantica]